jgi:hypothetical protein
MKVALNPAELRVIVDALDDKHQFQLQSGEGRVWSRGALTPSSQADALHLAQRDLVLCRGRKASW